MPSTERLCVTPLGFTAFPRRVWWEWVWDKSCGCTEGLPSLFPVLCLREKFGLKLPKHIHKVITFVFNEACVDSSACVEEFELFGVMWQEQDRISLLDLTHHS